MGAVTGNEDPGSAPLTFADLARAFPTCTADALRILQAKTRETDSHESIDNTLDCANEIIGGFGVEALRSEHAWVDYYCDITLLYVNMGDPYTPTLWYDVGNDCFGVGGWGDWLESYEAENPPEEGDE